MPDDGILKVMSNRRQCLEGCCPEPGTAVSAIPQCRWPGALPPHCNADGVKPACRTLPGIPLNGAWRLQVR